MEIRLAAPEDASGMTRLLRERYGDIYDMPLMYDAASVAKELSNGSIRAVVADDGERLVGMGATMADDYFAGCALLFLLTVSESARSNHVGSHINAALCALDYPEFASVYAHALTLNTISQVLLEGKGFAPAGLILERIPFDKCSARFESIALPDRHTHICMSRKAAKEETGRLFVPGALKEYVFCVYDSLKCRVTDNLVFTRESIREIDYPEHNYIEYIGGLPDKLPERESVNLFLSMNADNCENAYESAKERGFFFTGVQPLAERAEYLIMHYSGSRDSSSAAIKTAKTIDSFAGRKQFLLEMCQGE